MTDETTRTLVRGLESMGVYPMGSGHWRVTCKLCKRHRQFSQAEVLNLRTLRLAFCADCMKRMQVAVVTVGNAPVEIIKA